MLLISFSTESSKEFLLFPQQNSKNILFLCNFANHGAQRKQINFVQPIARVFFFEKAALAVVSIFSEITR